MSSNEHLQQLLEVRSALLREVARLDLVIAREHRLSHPQEGVRFHTDHDLSWEEALHHAKIPLSHEEFLAG